MSLPKVATWEMTRRCNLSCIHCYNESGSAISYELPIEKCYGLIDRIKELDSIDTLILTGGEPLYSQNIEGIAKYSRPRFRELVLQTNGLLIPYKSDDLLKNFDEAMISVYGRKKTDEFFKRASETDVSKSLARLRELRVPFSISTVLTSRNMNDIAYLYEYSKCQGAKTLLLQEFVPKGRGELARNLVCNSEKSRELKNKLREMDKEHFIVFSSEQPCGGGTHFVEIDYLGNVSPCAFLPFKDNVFKKSLLDIVENSDNFKKFIDFKKEKKHCPLFYGKLFA